MIDLNYPTKFLLMQLLTKDGPAVFTFREREYILQSIQRESGSGKTFNIRAKDELNREHDIFIRTLD